MAAEPFTWFWGGRCAKGNPFCETCPWQPRGLGRQQHVAMGVAQELGTAPWDTQCEILGALGQWAAGHMGGLARLIWSGCVSRQWSVRWQDVMGHGVRVDRHLTSSVAWSDLGDTWPASWAAPALSPSLLPLLGSMPARLPCLGLRLDPGQCKADRLLGRLLAAVPTHRG